MITAEHLIAAVAQAHERLEFQAETSGGRAERASARRMFRHQIDAEVVDRAFFVALAEALNAKRPATP